MHLREPGVEFVAPSQQFAFADLQMLQAGRAALLPTGGVRHLFVAGDQVAGLSV